MLRDYGEFTYPYHETKIPTLDSLLGTITINNTPRVEKLEAARQNQAPLRHHYVDQSIAEDGELNAESFSTPISTRSHKIPVVDKVAYVNKSPEMPQVSIQETPIIKKEVREVVKPIERAVETPVKEKVYSPDFNEEFGHYADKIKELEKSLVLDTELVLEEIIDESIAENMHQQHKSIIEIESMESDERYTSISYSIIKSIPSMSDNEGW